jgi:hypothetical protein
MEDIKSVNKAKQKQQVYRQDVQKIVDQVLTKRSTGNRARAAYELWLTLNPMVQVTFGEGKDLKMGWLPARRVDSLTKAKVKMLKDNLKNKYATNETGSMRLGLEMPPALLHFIQLFHPDIYDTDAGAKDRFRKLVKAFPEFQIMEKI